MIVHVDYYTMIFVFNKNFDCFYHRVMKSKVRKLKQISRFLNNFFPTIGNKCEIPRIIVAYMAFASLASERSETGRNFCFQARQARSRLSLELLRRAAATGLLALLAHVPRRQARYGPQIHLGRPASLRGSHGCNATEHISALPREYDLRL